MYKMPYRTRNGRLIILVNQLCPPLEHTGKQCETICMVIEKIAGELGVQLSNEKIEILRNKDLLQLQKEFYRQNIRPLNPMI